MTYLIQERGQYEPPACPGCLKPHWVDWKETTTFEELARGEQTFLPGQTCCRTPGCAYNGTEQAVR